MMQNLDSLKDLWRQQGESHIKFSQEDIQKMVRKRSSSIVVWILIISVLEFLLPNLIFLFTDFESTLEFHSKYGMSRIMEVYLTVHVIIIFGFIYVFYKNYKNISAESEVKELLSNILKTRRTVKYYIYYNLAMMVVIGLNMFYKVYHSPVFLEELPDNSNMLLIWTISVVLLCLAVFVFWIIYRVMYGFFLKKLKKNYAELLSNESL